MSYIADFRLIDIEKLSELKELAKPKKIFQGQIKDNFLPFLNENSTKLKEYPWSGYVYITLLVYLGEKGIKIGKSKFSELTEYLTEARGSTYIIIANENKEKFIEMFDPLNFNEVELANYYNEFNETDENEAGRAMIDAINVLYDNMKYINEEMVIVFSI